MGPRSAAGWIKLSRIDDELCVDVILAPGTHTLESSL